VKVKKEGSYQKIIEKIFFDRYQKGATEILFDRADIGRAARELTIEIPKNIGDVLYSVRFRTPMPATILATQPEGYQWLIEMEGRAKYCFRLQSENRITPNSNLAVIRIPDSTPEIIAAYALDDEQALLAKVRYNRIIDIFLGLTTFSLQNHLRTSVRNI
jgi:hypothetical protein